jgi:hypothetical protein
MSSVMLAADNTAIEGRYPPAGVQPALPSRKGASLLRRIQGVAAGVFFLATRAPFYIVVLFFGALVSVAGVVLYLIKAIGIRATRPTGTAAAAALALVSIAGPRHAKADSVTGTSLLQQNTWVFSQQTNLYDFDAPGAGTLSVTLEDWVFPVDLQQVTASIMFQDQSWSLTPLQGSQNPEWVLNLPISSGGTFAAFVAAEAGATPFGPGTQNFGAYSLDIDFSSASTVPLPPAIDLLIGGVGLLGAVSLIERISRRRNTDVISLA